ncbi:MAG: T9SS type A sorting domain-containing protein [bacterium]
MKTERLHLSLRFEARNSTKLMQKKFIKAFSVLLCFLFAPMLFPTQTHCEVLWEKELHTNKFIQLTSFNLFTEKFYECNGYYYILYFGKDSTTAVKSYGKWEGNEYPALLKFDMNGNTIYQNEKVIPKIDSLKEAEVTLSQEIRGFKYNDNVLTFDIPQSAGTQRTPNIYNFSTTDGSILGIAGTIASAYQWLTTLKSFFIENDLFVLAGGLFDQTQSRIDVHNQIANEYEETLKYRITLEMNSFIDSLREDSYAMDFLMVNDHSFIVTFPGKDKKTIIAKYSYDKEEASKLPNAGIITADLDWYKIYKPKADRGFKQFQLLDNGNLLMHHGNGSLVVLDKNSEVIFNKVILDDSYKNYTIDNVMSLKYHSGYFALWGYYIENSERNFAVIITDSDWNVVDAIQWDYNEKSNSVTDVKEKENGNLIVYGNSLYKEINESGTNFLYIPYYAEIKTNYVGVNEPIADEGFTVSPQPANDFITIALKPSEGFEPSEGSKITIYNTLSEKVMTVEQTFLSVQRINISALPKGIYFVKFGNLTSKFVKF